MKQHKNVSLYNSFSHKITMVANPQTFDFDLKELPEELKQTEPFLFETLPELKLI